MARGDESVGISEDSDWMRDCTVPADDAISLDYVSTQVPFISLW